MQARADLERRPEHNCEDTYQKAPQGGVMASARRGEVRVHVDAPPDVVWALVADLDRMGEWSPECYRVEWLDGAASTAKPAPSR